MEGNVVILLNTDEKLTEFYTNLSKVASNAKLPPNVLTVVPYCEHKFVKNLCEHGGVATFLNNSKLDEEIDKKIERSIRTDFTVESVLPYVSTLKHVWATSGISFL